MKMTLTQFLVEDAKSRAATKRVVDYINTATNNKYSASIATKTGSTQSVVAIKVEGGKIPTDVYDVFKKHKIGVGDKEVNQNDDGTSIIKFSIMEM